METLKQTYEVRGYYHKYLSPRHKHPTPRKISFDYQFPAKSEEDARRSAIERCKIEHGHVSSRPVVEEVKKSS